MGEDTRLSFKFQVAGLMIPVDSNYDLFGSIFLLFSYKSR